CAGAASALARSSATYSPASATGTAGPGRVSWRARRAARSQSTAARSGGAVAAAAGSVVIGISLRTPGAGRGSGRQDSGGRRGRDRSRGAAARAPRDRSGHSAVPAAADHQHGHRTGEQQTGGDSEHAARVRTGDGEAALVSAPGRVVALVGTAFGRVVRPRVVRAGADGGRVLGRLFGGRLVRGLLARLVRGLLTGLVRGLLTGLVRRLV